MATFEIVPSATFTSPLEVYNNVKLNDCRRFCNDMNNCTMFSWDAPPNEKLGTCQISFNNTKTLQPSSSSTVYIKKENSSYWSIILFGILILLILFYSFCKKCHQ